MLKCYIHVLFVKFHFGYENSRGGRNSFGGGYPRPPPPCMNPSQHWEFVVVRGCTIMHIVNCDSYLWITWQMSRQSDSHTKSNGCISTVVPPTTTTGNWSSRPWIFLFCCARPDSVLLCKARSCQSTCLMTHIGGMSYLRTSTTTPACLLGHYVCIAMYMYVWDHQFDVRLDRFSTCIMFLGVNLWIFVL